MKAMAAELCVDFKIGTSETSLAVWSWRRTALHRLLLAAGCLIALQTLPLAVVDAACTTTSCGNSCAGGYYYTNYYECNCQNSMLFPGVTFCDYAEPDFACKPHAAFYVKTMKEAGVEQVEDCWFVDDSEANVRAALELVVK